jgi:hypothetical protein
MPGVQKQKRRMQAAFFSMPSCRKSAVSKTEKAAGNRGFSGEGRKHSGRAASSGPSVEAFADPSLRKGMRPFSGFSFRKAPRRD